MPGIGIGIGLALGGGSGGGGGVSLPTLAFAGAVAQAEGASGTTAFTFTLNLTRNGSTAAIPFTWTVAGSGANPANAADFVGGVLPGGNGTFAAGETSKPIVVNVAADSNVEPDEGFTVTAQASLPLAPASATGTIVNDDVALPGLSGVNGIVAHGDSLTARDIAGAIAWPTQVQRQTTKPVRNVAKSGYRVDDLTTLYDSDVGPLYNASTFNTLVFLGGTNDVIQGATAATIQNRLIAYWNKAKTTGFKLVVATLPAQGNLNATQIGVQNAVNAWIKANYATYADQLAKLDERTELSDPNNLTYYRPDKLHFTTAGSQAQRDTFFPLLGLPVEMGTLNALFTDGDFASGAGGWNLGAGWTAGAGKVSKASGSSGNLARSFSAVPIGTRILVQWDILDWSATGYTLMTGGGYSSSNKTSNATYVDCFVVTSATTALT